MIPPPPFAALCWATSTDLYIQLPSAKPDADPVVLAFSIANGGLHKALPLISGPYKRPEPKRTIVAHQETTYEIAGRVLRKLGMIG